MATIAASELDATEATARRILVRRLHEIDQNRLDGRNWFIAIIDQAAILNARAAAWERRRAA